MVNKNKNKLAVSCLLLGSILLGTWSWRVFTGTPRYSLGQLKVAIDKNEPSEIKKYFDVEAIANQMVDFTLESTQRQAVENNDIFGILGNSLGVAEMFRPQLQQRIEQMFEESLTQISEDDFLDVKLTSIERNESEAVATFELNPLSEAENLPLSSISLLLEQQPSKHWKIVGLEQGTLKAISESMN